MPTIEKLYSTLETLYGERAAILAEGWYLQDCWLVQVKPGGTARTNRRYWQVRSRKPLLDGKRVKQLKPADVPNYRQAIDRGRQLKRVDRQIEKLQKKLDQQTATSNSPSGLSKQVSPLAQPTIQIPELLSSPQPIELKPAWTMTPKALLEQELLVKETIASSQELRASLQKSMNHSKALMEHNQSLRDQATEQAKRYRSHSR